MLTSLLHPHPRAPPPLIVSSWHGLLTNESRTPTDVDRQTRFLVDCQSCAFLHTANSRHRLLIIYPHSSLNVYTTEPHLHRTAAIKQEASTAASMTYIHAFPWKTSPLVDVRQAQAVQGNTDRRANTHHLKSTATSHNTENKPLTNIGMDQHLPSLLAQTRLQCACICNVITQRLPVLHRKGNNIKREVYAGSPSLLHKTGRRHMLMCLLSNCRYSIQ